MIRLFWPLLAAQAKALIAGLEDVTDGEITIGDSLVNDVPRKDREVTMVFQNHALYPHMTVYANMAFALKDCV